MSCFSCSRRSCSRVSTESSAPRLLLPTDAAAVPTCYPSVMHPTDSVVTVTARGAARLRAGNPWVFAPDVAPSAAAVGGDVVRVVDGRGTTLGTALWAPGAKLPLRLLSRATV